MYAEIHIDILHFNEDTKKSIVLYVKMQKKTTKYLVSYSNQIKSNQIKSNQIYLRQKEHNATQKKQSKYVDRTQRQYETALNLKR